MQQVAEVRGTLTRRNAIGRLAAAGGALVLACGSGGWMAATAADETPPARKPEDVLRAYLHIAETGVVTVVVPAAEMGQGATTALPMILAEELDVRWADVRSVPAMPDPAFGDDISTEGSYTTQGYYEELRHVGASARAMLVAAAAQRWSVPESECGTAAGFVAHAPTGRRAGYGSLAADAARLPVPTSVTLKTADQYRIVGKPTAFIDLQKKTDGTAKYGIDVRVPGMLVGAVKHCARFGANVAAVDSRAARAMPGVRDVVRLEDAVVVVADTFWHAKRAADAVVITEAGGVTLNNADIGRAIADRLPRRGVAREGSGGTVIGDAERAIAASRSTIDATYRFPFLAHAPMEPVNCTAAVTGDRCEIWTGTQSPTRAQQIGMKITGLPASRVIVHTMLLGGGFGRRSKNDFVEKAVAVAKHVGRPVKVMWTREQDVAHDFYRPVAGVRVRAAISDAGSIAVATHVVAPSIDAAVDPQKNGAAQFDTFALGGSRAVYAFSDFLGEYTRYEPGVPVWFMRSVSNSYTTFALECTLEDLARKSGRDPVDLRRSLLRAAPRGLAVVNAAAARAGWTKPRRSGRHLGFAYTAMRGSHVAAVVELSMPSASRVRLHRITCVADCGLPVNPQALEAQIQGGIIYGLSATVWGEISISGGRAVQQNFDQYRVARMQHVPTIDVELLTGASTPNGVGEIGAGIIAPALANAIAAASGRRLLSLPLASHGLELSPAFSMQNV